jgi:hypothetical protein
MSIPLDRLYNFLDSISDHNLIIYAWREHGSRNISHFGPLNILPAERHIKETIPLLIFHDQEPLDYEFIQNQIEQESPNTVAWAEHTQQSGVFFKEFFYKHIHLKSLMISTLYDLSMIVHSEKNSSQVITYQQNKFVPVYYWCHAVIARDWFRFAEHDPLLTIKAPNPKNFLIYNRAWQGTREYRLKFAELLVNTGLYQNCITSFATIDNHNHYTDHVFKNDNFILKRSDLEKILIENTHNSAASADYSSYDYQNSLIEVVLETLFDDTRNHLTEKSLRPIACRQPFILASTPGSLQYLRDYGFRTFEKYIDETYDTIQNASERLQAIITEMQRISNLTPQQKHQLTHDIQPILDHNQKWFFSEEFHNLVINEFSENLNNAITEVKSGTTGTLRKKFMHVEKICKNLGIDN